MSFADQLLEQPDHLANREKKRPRQASLRRAVSTAYYALFHFLIFEATKNWKRVEQRNALARVFIQSQQQRHTADYDNAKQWTRTEVLNQIDKVAAAFRSWKVIRDEDIAQAYLVSLLGKDR